MEQLVWHKERDNPIGRTYIATLEARDLSDRNATTFYADMTAEGFGPNVAFTAIDENTPASIPNRKPAGDIWIDTKDQRNHKYIYRTNTAWQSDQDASASGYVFPNVDAKGAWAQTVHVGTFDSGNATGWWGVRDETVFDGTDHTARADALSAIQLATDAQAAADREIVVFFAQENDPPNTTTGNGDIWIVNNYITFYNDSTNQYNANTSSIRIANTLAGVINATTDTPGTRFWHISPDNAVGLTYLTSFADGADARSITDGKILNHYGPEYGSGPYFGPDPEFHSKLDENGNRVYNPTPQGDRWVNTSNNNIEFIYNQNNASIEAYAQTIFWHPGAGFDSVSYTHLTLPTNREV